jgi:hypothetical protein
MKHLKIFEEVNVTDYRGFLITIKYYGPDGVGATAILITGNNWQKMRLDFAEKIFGVNEEGLDSKFEERDYYDWNTLLESCEELMEESGINFNFFEFKIFEKTPNINQDFFEDIDLLDIEKINNAMKKIFK